MAESPSLHQEPEPHDFVAYPVQTDAGPATLSRCRFCSKTREQIAAEEASSAEPANAKALREAK